MLFTRLLCFDYHIVLLLLDFIGYVDVFDISLGMLLFLIRCC